MKSEDREEFFPEFVKKISKFTGKDIVETMRPNFTTTTPVSLAIGQLTIMSTMKHYFRYICNVIGCGFPYITIEGTIEDWTKILNKLSNLVKYNFKWFTKKTIPIIKKIIETKKGIVDKKFWKMMIRIKNGNGFYNPSIINGWFVSFFPFDKDGDHIYDSINSNNELQSEVQKVPFKLKIIGQGTFDCFFLAGFVGLSQDEKTASIKPEIGWFIKKTGSDTNVELDKENDSENDDDKDDEKNKSADEDFKEDSDNDNEEFKFSYSFDDFSSDEIY